VDNTSGLDNSAFGASSLASNTTGNNNTASGAGSLNANTTGIQNTAHGKDALLANTTGFENTAVGTFALQSNTVGNDNDALGAYALTTNTGDDNTALGTWVLNQNTSGSRNTGAGRDALLNNATGTDNTAMGWKAGLSLTTGSNNIDIGAGVQGVAGESNTIRIGNGTTRAFVQGIFGTTTGVNDAVSVIVDSNGQLGTVNSSRRYKFDIRDMGDATDGLMKLRPVTFRYKAAQADGTHPVQWGLIAEEVDEVYPDLVVHDAQGRAQTVQYWKLEPMMLNELQKQHVVLREQDETIQRQQDAIDALTRRLEELERKMELQPAKQ
jgi:hypothetical protein